LVVNAHPKALLDERGGFATTGELLTVMTRQQLDVQVKKGCLVRVWCVEWHAGRAEMLRDRVRFARLQECGWTVIPIIVDDVRRDPRGLTDRIAYHLSRSRLAG
jgi:hypothetical protein